MVNAANAIVVVFGLFILAASCWGVVAPTGVLRMVDGIMASNFGMVVAISSRVILGVSLIVAAPTSWTPTLFFVVGVLSLTAATALPFIGRERVAKLVTWLQKWPINLVRLWLVFGAVFGAYLIYAVVIQSR